MTTDYSIIQTCTYRVETIHGWKSALAQAVHEKACYQGDVRFSYLGHTVTVKFSEADTALDWWFTRAQHPYSSDVDPAFHEYVVDCIEGRKSV